MLPDEQIEFELEAGRLGISPRPEAAAIQPASVDLRLAHEFGVPPTPTPGDYIDPIRGTRHENPQIVTLLAASYMLAPLSFCLARTVEHVTLHPSLAARVEGKSTLGRHGLAIHATAGYIDPGFSGTITLELFNFTQFPILLAAGMPICQLAIHRMESQPRRPYGHPELGSHYQNQKGVTPAR